MNRVGMPTRTLPDVLVPRTLISDPDRFGGHPAGDCLAGDLIIQGGKAVGLRGAPPRAPRVILPPLTEPHAHLDKCHSIDRMRDVGGDLARALAAQRADKARWTPEIVAQAAERGLRELVASGCGTVRSHVDWGNDTDGGVAPLAWEVIGDVAARHAITVQRAALTGIDQLADPDFARRCAGRMARDGGVLGSFVHLHSDRAAGIANAFREAERHGLALDFHVDEGLETDLDGLEIIADCALETGFEGPVLCGHACSLANADEATLARIADKLAQAGISIAALPQTNLYLQGRRPGTPDRRGITRVRELRAAGVDVVLGADNVRDAFCPIGTFDPLRVLGLAVLTAHLDPPFAPYLPMISTGARRALGLSPQFVDDTALETLLVIDAASVSDLLSSAPRPSRLTDLTEEKT